MDKSKRKLLISMVVIMFVLLSIVATIAIAFALTQQNISTSLKISYVAEDIDGKVSATYTITDGKATVKDSGYLTAFKNGNAQGTDLSFAADEDISSASLNFADDIEFKVDACEMVICYTFTNNSEDVDYIADVNFTASKLENMSVEYSLNGEDYSDKAYALMVTDAKTENYYVKIKLDSKTKDAALEGGAFNWVLKGCGDYTEDEVATLKASTMQQVEGGYSVTLNGAKLTSGQEIAFPSSINGSNVITIKNAGLAAEQKAMVVSVYVPASVTTIEAGAFEGFTASFEFANYEGWKSGAQTFEATDLESNVTTYLSTTYVADAWVRA